jgi:hypothetical protein
LIKYYKPQIRKAHVASVYFKCFRRFKGILKVFHIYVAKIDQGVAYIASVSARHVVSVSEVYSKCFIC